MPQVTKHFSLDELLVSARAVGLGIDNTRHTWETFLAARQTAGKMEIVRDVLDRNPVAVGSWIRCLELNRALKSKDTSQHIKGEAVDFTCPRHGSPLELCRTLIKNQMLVDWDQLILEHTWVHISWSSLPNAKQKGQVLSLLASGSYATGLTNPQGIPYV